MSELEKATRKGGFFVVQKSIQNPACGRVRGLTSTGQTHTFSVPVKTGQRRFDSLRLRALGILTGFKKTAKARVACGSLTKGMPLSH